MSQTINETVSCEVPGCTEPRFVDSVADLCTTHNDQELAKAAEHDARCARECPWRFAVDADAACTTEALCFNCWVEANEPC